MFMTGRFAPEAVIPESPFVTNPTGTSARNNVCLRSPLGFNALVCRQLLCNGREEALHFFPQVRDRLAIAREMPQQASLEESIKQRIEGARRDDRLSATK